MRQIKAEANRSADDAANQIKPADPIEEGKVED